MSLTAPSPVFLIIVGVVLGGIACLLLEAILQVTRPRWRECLRCGCWFNEDGEVTSIPPACCNVGHPGVCRACSVEVHHS